MNTKNILGLSSAMLAMVLAFQNCGNKGGFSEEVAAGIQLDNKSQVPKSNVVDAFDVISVAHTYCQTDICSSEDIVFKSKQTIELKADNTVSGSAACNSYSGKYELKIRATDGTHLINFSNVLTTLRSCSQLDEEQLLHNALSSAYKISNSSGVNVQLYATNVAKNKQETLVLQLRRKGAVKPEPKKFELLARYRVVSLSETVCKTHTAAQKTPAPCSSKSVNFKSYQTIEFKNKGIVTGQAACNAFGGNYKYVARAKEATDLLSFSNVVATERACTLLSEEIALYDALSKAYKVESAGSGKIRLLLPKGSLLLQLEVQPHLGDDAKFDAQ